MRKYFPYFGRRNKNKNMKSVPDVIKHKDIKWEVCADPKVIATLFGLQGRFIKYVLLFSLYVGH